MAYCDSSALPYPGSVSGIIYFQGMGSPALMTTSLQDGLAQQAPPRSIYANSQPRRALPRPCPAWCILPPPSHGQPKYSLSLVCQGPWPQAAKGRHRAQDPCPSAHLPAAPAMLPPLLFTALTYVPALASAAQLRLSEAVLKDTALSAGSVPWLSRQKCDLGQT